MKKAERGLVAVVGIFLISFGVGVMPQAHIGSDPLTLLFEALSINVGLSIGAWNTIIGAIFLVISFVVDKKKIGFSTLLYVICGQYVIDGTIKLFPYAQNLYVAILYVIISSVTICFGAALTNTARLGLSYYDAYLFSVSEKIKMKYHIFRYINEIVFVVICVLFQHYPNLGTLYYFLSLGPIISFFIKLIRKPIRHHLGIPVDE